MFSTNGPNESVHPCQPWFRHIVASASAGAAAEFQVFNLILSGMTNEEVAAQLGVPVLEVGDAYRAAQAKFLRALRKDPFFILIEAALKS